MFKKYILLVITFSSTIHAIHRVKWPKHKQFRKAQNNYFSEQSPLFPVDSDIAHMLEGSNLSVTKKMIYACRGESVCNFIHFTPKNSVLVEYTLNNQNTILCLYNTEAKKSLIGYNNTALSKYANFKKAGSADFFPMLIPLKGDLFNVSSI